MKYQQGFLIFNRLFYNLQNYFNNLLFLVTNDLSNILAMMKNWIFKASLLLAVGFLFTDTAYADTDEPSVGIVEHLDAYLPSDAKIINTNGDTILLKSLIDKPTILSFVYYRCPGICTPLMDGIAELINNSNLKLGKDYRVLSISFNPYEDYTIAKKKHENYSTVVNKVGMENGWNFFVADSANIANLTTAAGFKYLKKGNDFVHTGGIIVLSPDGKITRYLNGVRFQPFEFQLAIIEATKGESGPTVNKLLQFCYSYDPVGQTYVLNVTKVAGIVILFFGILFFIILRFSPKSKK